MTSCSRKHPPGKVFRPPSKGPYKRKFLLHPKVRLSGNKASPKKIVQERAGGEGEQVKITRWAEEAKAATALWAWASPVGKRPVGKAVGCQSSSWADKCILGDEMHPRSAMAAFPCEVRLLQ